MNPGGESKKLAGPTLSLDLALELAPATLPVLFCGAGKGVRGRGAELLVRLCESDSGYRSKSLDDAVNLNIGLLIERWLLFGPYCTSILGL